MAFNPQDADIEALRLALSDSVNVRRYGAKGDGTTDDWAAIQAALDDVPSTGGQVFFPAGNYRIEKPLRLKTRNTRLFGAGQSSNITIGGYRMGLVIGAEQTALPLAAPLNPAGYGMSADWSNLAPGEAWLDLTEAFDLRTLDGTSALTIKLWYSPAEIVHGKCIVASSGQVTVSSPVQQAFALLNDNGFMKFELNVSGTKRSIVDPVAMTLGGVYHYAATYDGTTLRLFRNGIMAASLVAAGVIRQHPMESVAIGGRWQGWHQTRLFGHGPSGKVSSLQIAGGCHYTANFTVPQNHTHVPDSFVTLNFDDQWDIFTAGFTKRGWVHFPLHRAEYALNELGEITIDSLYFLGGGTAIYAYNVIRLTLRNLVLLYQQCHGIYLRNNCYLSRLSNISMTSGSYQGVGAVGILLKEACGVVNVDDVDIQGCFLAVGCSNGSVVMKNAYLASSSVGFTCCWLDGSAGATGGASLTAMLCTDESGAGIENALIINDMRQVTCVGCSFETLSAVMTSFVIADRVATAGVHEFINCQFGNALAADFEVFELLGTWPQGSIGVTRPWLGRQDLDWGDDIGAVRFVGSPGTSSTGNTGRNGHGTATVLAGATSATVTLPNPEPDTAYRVHLTPGANATPYWSAKATTGFTINLPSAPGSDIAVDWSVTR